MDEVFFFQLLS